jgi:hypothetical protein
MPIPLQYRAATTIHWTNPPSLAFPSCALFSGCTPMVIGMITFLAWVFTRDDQFAFFGLITILVGLCLLAIGGICWLIHLVRVLRLPASSERSRHIRWSVIAVIAMGANFPLCAVLFLIAVCLQ